MSQPPYQPYPGQPGPESGGGYQPPAAPGSYPPPSSGAGGYPPPSSGAGSYPPPGQGSYPPPSDQGSYPPPSGQGSYPPGDGSYQQPGGAVPPYGSAPPPKKKSALKIVLIVAAVIAVLCVAGIGVAVFAAKDKVEQVVDATKITVVEPQTLGGRDKASDPALQSSVEGLDSEMAKIPGSTGSVGAIYGDIQKQDIVMVAAASSINGSPQSRYDEFTEGLGQGGIKLQDLSDTDPGPLGGIAKCGDSNSSGVPMAVCVWSDNGSVGMIAMMFKGKADLEKEFVAMRGEIEKKS
ncbi:hypothetical protein ACPCHT_35045 [Nucisporomicrobium flavum]|jgi:hypothetical protein|uniref:hypothetical protein n=1 Tax=Nucisporomicrobium flavum TaxID=2785915 RepID=UPI0018F4B955|nr:hypothetical protein [Nucisporomicrobium flavum]